MRRATVADIEYGHVCPECAEPKTLQALRCSACYRDARRAGVYPPPPVMYGPKNPSWKGGITPRPTGAPRGRPQPQNHPWRRRRYTTTNGGTK